MTIFFEKQFFRDSLKYSLNSEEQSMTPLYDNFFRQTIFQGQL